MNKYKINFSDGCYWSSARLDTTIKYFGDDNYKVERAYIVDFTKKKWGLEDLLLYRARPMSSEEDIVRRCYVRATKVLTKEEVESYRLEDSLRKKLSEIKSSNEIQKSNTISFDLNSEINTIKNLNFSSRILKGPKMANSANSGITVAGGSGQGNSAVQLNEPGTVFVKGNKLYVADASNNRILVWSL